MHLNTVYFIIAVILASTSISADPIGRIIGGFPISIQTIPYQVSIQIVEIDGSTGHFCGGSIINENYILTASHCVENLEVSDLAILVGTERNDEKAQKNSVKRIIMHKQYDTKTIDYDIALLELIRPLEFNENVQPIQLVDEYDKVLDETKCLVSGWGNTNGKFRGTNNRLKGVEVPIINQQICRKNYKDFGGLTSRMLCAGFQNGGKDSCEGDSGGPLACQLNNHENGNLTLVGVVSWGVDCGKPNQPGVYARISSLRQWIRDNAGI